MEDLIARIKELDYALSMHALTLAQIEGMKIANQEAIENGCAPPYNEGHFQDVAEENGMNHNASVVRHQI